MLLVNEMVFYAIVSMEHAVRHPRWHLPAT